MSSNKSNKFIACSFDGKITPYESLQAYWFERAFRYGDACFETMKMSKGVIHFLEDHLRRLSYTLKKLQISPPKKLQKQYIIDQVHQLSESQGALYKPCRIRLQVIRKAGGYYEPENNSSHIFIELSQLDHEEYSLNHDGIKVVESNEMVKSATMLSGLKSANALLYIMAAIHARRMKADDCLIKNSEGHYTDGISSNIFVVKTHQVYTPPLSDGCISGIMRKQIIKIAQDEKITVKEESLNRSFLKKADEIWLVNSINGIVWIDSFYSNTLRKTYARLFNDKLNEWVDRYRIDSSKNTESQ
ncbi:MAG TPA: aminotransferase class IV [Bacteroidia bacterium]|nr:aminotransferase class IV [Bacteroidia bacterium]HNT80839.1 aminotransferase class IV [Bacteroidia bacterium]